MSADALEERFTELAANKNVVGVLILTAEGTTVKSNMDKAETNKFADIAYKLLKNSRQVLQENEAGSDDVKFLRLTTRKNEIMLSPDNQFMLVVISNVQDS